MQPITHGRSALPGRNGGQLRPKQSLCSSHSSHIRRLAPRLAAAGPGGTPSGTDPVGHVLQQHRLLMQAGFSYDQASLILRMSQQPASLSSAALLSEAQAAAAAGVASQQQAAATLSSSSSSISAAPAGDEQQQQQQPSSLQDQQLTALQKRVSFLEMELLKQSLMIDAAHASSATIAAPPAAAAGSGGWAAGEAPPSGPLPSSLQQPVLDPHVAALAEALAIRQALLSPAAAAALAASGALTGSADPQHAPRQPSSIWGRRRLQQLQAKPWRYRDGATAPAAGQSRHAWGVARDGHGDGGGDEGDDELVAYEPQSAQTMVATMLVVYVGVLFAFVAMLAGGGDIPADIPADILWDISP